MKWCILIAVQVQSLKLKLGECCAVSHIKTAKRKKGSSVWIRTTVGKSEQSSRFNCMDWSVPIKYGVCTESAWNKTRAVKQWFSISWLQLPAFLFMRLFCSSSVHAVQQCLTKHFYKYMHLSVLQLISYSAPPAVSAATICLRSLLDDDRRI